MNKLMLVDVDGVLLDWEYSFDRYLQKRGYVKVPSGSEKYDIGKRYGISYETGRDLIKNFNESAHIGFLPPHKDAVHYVKKLHEECGIVFHAITSLSLDNNAYKLRKSNLEKLFGETVFQEITCLDTGADKDDALAPYKDSGLYFVEDKILNAETGIRLGLNSILMKHPHNMDYNGNAPVVDNWRDIYNLVVGD